jgi:hypothetical protein
MDGESRFRVLVTDYAWPTLDIERAELAGCGAELVVAERGDVEELVELAADCDAILTFLLVTTIFGVACRQPWTQECLRFRDRADDLRRQMDRCQHEPGALVPAGARRRALGHPLGYWAGPILGTCVAAFFWEAFHLTKEEKAGGDS